MSLISPISLKGPAEVAHGWMFIGFTLNMLLLGVMMTQVYMYYAQYKGDKAWIKIFVAGLFLADTVNTIFMFVYLYRCFITFFGDNDALSTADWLFATEPSTTGLIACAVQLFFAWRVYVLSKTWIYAGFITVLAVTGGIASIVTAVEVGRTPNFVDFQNFKATVIVWLASEAICDVVITTVLGKPVDAPSLLTTESHLSGQRKHKTGFQRSDMVVDRIIRITVQTGLITMIIASLDLLFFLIDPSGTHLLFNFPLAKLYSNSLMSSLNSRRGWKYTGNTSESRSEGQVNTTGGVIQRRDLQISSKKPNDMIVVDGTRTHPEVFVHVESHEMRDVQSNDRFDDKKAFNSETSVDKSVEDKWTPDQKSQWVAS
ncbi:hypothetical protein NLJ89_g8959 [Agrocybe chaxingu]|uniref:DUF6534 domain-containing protein n=1 Tax=Agrocybe chaxingu TaxID=84603 RepID=A0A9W8JRN8_9AGAR|nr:hypothetical protein NLJ89_g8959 [Agrocybe chaxingu]